MSIVIVLGCLLAIAVGLELAMRWAHDVPLLTRENFVARGLDVFADNPNIAYHPTLGWTITPSRREVGGEGTLSTDEHSTRLPSPAARALPVGGILASGDSYTAGSEVSDEETWPAQLEAILGVPVVNAAGGGWGTDQIVLRAEQMLDIARPAVLVIGFLWYDIGRSEFRLFGRSYKPYFTVVDGALRLHNTPVPRLSGNREEIGLQQAILGRSYAMYVLARRLGWARWRAQPDIEDRRAVPHPVGVDITCLLLDRLKATTEARGIRLLLVMQYGAGDFEQDAQAGIAMRVLDHASRIGIDTIDTWPDLKRRHDADPQSFRTLFVVHHDGVSLGHMSAAGNRLVAERLAGVLAGDPRLPTARAPS